MAEIIEIAPRGDLVVAVGSEQNVKLARVSSELTKLASQVFDAMLSPCFKEGQTKHDAADPLKLPKDDPTSMLNLFYILHYATDMGDPTKADWLQNLVISCDKYSCASKLRDFIHYRAMSASLSESDSFIVFGLIEHTTAFEIFAERLVRMPRKQAESSCHKQLLSLMPAGTFDAMQTYRTSAFHQYQFYVQKIVQYLYTSRQVVDYRLCHGLQLRLTAFYRSLFKHGVLRVSDTEDARLPDMRQVLISQFCNITNPAPAIDKDQNIDLHMCSKKCLKCQWKIAFAIEALANVNFFYWGTSEHCKVCYKCFQERKFGFANTCSHRTLNNGNQPAVT